MTSNDTTVTPAAAAAFNKANSAFREHDYKTALTEAEVAISKCSQLAVARVIRARCLNNLGQTETARDAYLACLDIEPVNFNAHLELGNVLQRLGQTARSLTHYQQAHVCRPTDHRPHLALAKQYAMQASDAARVKEGYHYHLALVAADASRRDGVTVHQEMARARLGSGDSTGALDAIRQAWMVLQSLTEQDATLRGEVLMDTAQAQFRLGLNEDARQTLENAARSEDASVLRATANTCYNYNFWPEGIAVLQRAVALHPNDIDVHLSLADMASRCWKLNEAEAALERATSLGAVSKQSFHRLSARISNNKGDVEAAGNHYRSLLEYGVFGAASSIAMNSLYSSTKSGVQVAQLHRSLFCGEGGGAGGPEEIPNSRDSNKPLRIGMVTADLFRQHPVNLFMQPLLARWPHREMPLAIYYTGTSYDTQTNLAKERSTYWRETGYEQLPKQVVEDKIDILIDLAGHTSPSAMNQFACRMAPVQVTYLGYPGSTWVPSIDWIIADGITAPRDHADQFSERIAHLPHSVFCYAPEVDYPFPKFGKDTLHRPLTFGSFNNVPKLSPDTVSLWARVLNSVEGSRLLLKAPSFQDAGVIAKFRDRFAQHGIGSGQLEFRGPSSLDQMMQEYADVDIGLDPVHYNGGTTTLQAMWMGVPVLTLKGDKFASRMGASFMHAAGLDNWVARNEEDFVEKAKSIASNRTALVALKRSMRDRISGLPAWNADQFTKDFSACLNHIWDQR